MGRNCCVGQTFLSVRVELIQAWNTKKFSIHHFPFLMFHLKTIQADQSRPKYSSY
jgi:hypothetical protein